MVLRKIFVFFLTFLAYAGLHTLRQSWSYSKPQLQKLYDIQQSHFGIVDTSYLVSYSIGMATLGNLTTYITLRNFIGLGMIISSLFFISIPTFCDLFQGYNKIYVIVVMCLNGFFQSTGWPGIIAVMGNWFGQNRRGLLMGIWAINSNIGNMAAEITCNLLQQNFKLSWQYNFVVCGAYTVFIAMAVMLFLKQKPPKQNYKYSSESSIITDNLISNEKEQNKQQKKKNLNVFQALFLPRVPYYVVGYACLKGCIYGLLFWLPSYLDIENLNEQKGYISAMLDAGSLVGGLIIGYLGDKFSHRALFLSPLLVISSLIMLVHSTLLTGIGWTYYITMFGIGIFTGGPYNIIRSAITIDLGQQVSGQNVGSVSALIQGTASIFAAGAQIVISLVSLEMVFYLLCGTCVLATLALFPLFIRDFKTLKTQSK